MAAIDVVAKVGLGGGGLGDFLACLSFNSGMSAAEVDVAAI